MGASRKRGFWDMFTLMEDGKVKNTFLLYAFALSFVFLAAYGLAFALLIDPIAHLFSGLSPLLAGALECLVPSLVGTALCLGFQKLARNKALAPAAFGFLGVVVFAIGIAAIAVLDAQDYGMFLMLYVQVFLLPLVIGGGCTCIVWRRHANEMRQMKEESQKSQTIQRYRYKRED